jgi:sugar lactone lactonase YvrE
LAQDGFYVYYLPPGGKPLVRVTDNLVMPNGVVGTADGKLLYVADAGDGKTYVYRIQPDGALAERLEIRFEFGDDDRRRLRMVAYGQASLILLKALRS